MPNIWILLLLGLIVLVTHFLEGITGFGCTVLAMPFAILLVGVPTAKPVLTLYAFLLALYIVVQHWKKINWNAYRRLILLLLAGLPIGIALYRWLPQQILIWILTAFLFFVSVRGILASFRQGRPDGIPEKPALLLVFLGGILHGAFSSGGPLVIVYAAKHLQDKQVFRATLCLVWVTLNAILLGQMAVSSQFTMEAGYTALACAPALVIGTLLGDWAHRHIRDTVFTKLTYITLLLTAGAMLFV